MLAITGSASSLVREIVPLAMTSAPATAAESDRALLDRVARGDERALGRLYDRFSASLYAVAYRIAGERADAEEIVLEAFSQVWREAGRFQADKGSVAAWVTVICRSRALDLVRSRSRRSKLADKAVAADPDRVPALGARGVDSEAEVTQTERARRVGEALSNLSPPQREAIQLAYYDGLSQAEIAERLNQPLGTIKTRVRLAMQKLRDALRPYYFEGTP
jgi:RNA polymerase sigma-70 factor (ECF subfamily)